MRLPWIQVDADGQTRARLLGRLLGVPEPQGIGMAIALWTWALEMSAEGDFAGEVHGDAELVAAAVSWPVAETARLMTELQRVGFVATAPKLRVRGLDRYRRTWEKNHRWKSKPAFSGDRVPSTGANPARKTETETETEIKKEEAFPAARKKRAAAVKPVDPRHIPMRTALIETFRRKRGVEYPFDYGREDAEVRRLLKLGVEPTVLAAWDRALDSKYPTISTLAKFRIEFPRFVGRGEQTASQRRDEPTTPRPEGRTLL